MTSLPRFALLLGLLFAPSAQAQPGALPLLRVSENQRFLVTADGRPFFWLADTAWELLHRLNQEETEAYLTRRAQQGFTVIQTVALAELSGLSEPNREGHLPLIDQDPTRPNEAYFRHVDWVLARAETRGLYVALLPTWGDKWNLKWGVGPVVFTPANAAIYGEWLGRRFAGRNVIWVVGGDRPIESAEHRAVVDAMARGLRRGDGGRGLISFHPSGGRSSSDWFHDADWLDFNLRQNGHGVDFGGNYRKTRADYDRSPVKPVIDGEPAYEDHPIAFKAAELGHTTAADVRRLFYWNVFQGAFGHTYGHHSVWQMYAEGRAPVNAPLMPWSDALDQPGAAQMQHGRRLMESRPMLSRIPADDLIIPDPVATAVPGEGRYRFVATRDAHGSYAMVYVPVERRFHVRMSVISGPTARAWWYNPRSGEATPAGIFPTDREHAFIAPDPGTGLDWILVLDDAARNFPPPGTPSGEQAP